MEITCGVFIIDKKNSLLICHPTDEDINKWSIPKGLVEPGENYENAALREVEEETGINLKDFNGDLVLIGEEHYANKHKKLIAYSFNLEVDIDTPLKCSGLITGTKKTEVDKYKWVNLDDAYLYIQPEQSILLNNLIKKQYEI